MFNPAAHAFSHETSVTLQPYCSLPVIDCKDTASLPDCLDLYSAVSFLAYVPKALSCAPSSPFGADLFFPWELSHQR